MNFEFSSDQMLLKDQARKFLESEESVKKSKRSPGGPTNTR